MSIKDFSEFMKVNYEFKSYVNRVRSLEWLFLIMRKDLPMNSSLHLVTCQVYKRFRINLIFSLEEFTRDISESESIVRFDLMRYIFLERNL